jgi:hypothetical protein
MKRKYVGLQHTVYKHGWKDGLRSLKETIKLLDEDDQPENFDEISYEELYNLIQELIDA